MQAIAIPFSFIKERFELSWPDVAWGFDKNWMNAESVIEYAVDRAYGDVTPAELELASLTKFDLNQVPILLEQLPECHGYRGNDADSCRISSRKWLFIALAFLYSTRAALADPLGAVEELYADFDYPDEIRCIVRYASQPEVSKITDACYSETERQIVRNWRELMLST